jgi:hypothetical protein
MIFGFDFRNTCFSSASRQQLTNITRAIKSCPKAAQSRSRLLRLIESHAFDPAKGFYVPVSDFLKLTGKLPTYSEQLRPTDFPSAVFPYSFFTNALLIPLGYGTDSFNDKPALEPKYRATNIGFLVATIEYDCETTEQMEECLAWTRCGDGKGDFSRAPFAAVDRELARFADYRGHTIVFTGRRSLHSHLIFSTKHLENAPWDLMAEERLAHSHSNLLHEAHQTYWDAAEEIFQRILQPSLQPDDKLRRLTQWKRSPWALRLLDEGAEVLGLPKGTVIPQLVIQENIRTRASRNAQQFLVPPEFSAKQSRPIKSRNRKCTSWEVGDEKLLTLVQEVCREEWGDYPKPAAVRSDGREWTINFWNHAQDHKPSTFVKGPHRRLVLCGQHSFNQHFYLPDHISADELCDGLTEADRQTEDTPCLPSPEIPPFLTSEHQPKRNWIESQIDRIHSSFAEPIAETASDEIKTVYRQRLSTALWEARIFDAHMVIRGPEGIGKTTRLLDELALEILDLAMSIYPKQRFACIACRSIPQAEAKAQEYEQSGKYRNAVVLMSVQKHYERQCEAQEVEPIPSYYFPDHSLNGFLGHIRSKQPEVFAALEKTRHKLWKGEDGVNLFNSGNTILFTTHALVRCWDCNHTTRTWYHPAYEPFADQDHEAMRADLTLCEIVIDEPEIDVVLNRIPESLFDWLKRMKRRYPGWNSKSWQARFEIYKAEKAANEIPGRHEFEEIDELMRLKLDELHPQEVNYEAIPFGFDQKTTGIYSVQTGELFYVGVRNWIQNCNARLTFLTTEALITDILIQAYGKLPIRNPIVLDLHAPSKLFPIEVPLIIDRRATKRKITTLVDEILAANPDAVIIANGSDLTDPRILNYQLAKGVNGLEDNDIIVIATCLSPEHYAELNVVGQWLELPGIIRQHYEDQITQAVGRNTGFRKSEKPTNTTLICSNRLAKILKSCFQHPSARVRLSVKKRGCRELMHPVAQGLQDAP